MYKSYRLWLYIHDQQWFPGRPTPIVFSNTSAVKLSTTAAVEEWHHYNFIKLTFLFDKASWKDVKHHRSVSKTGFLSRTFYQELFKRITINKSWWTSSRIPFVSICKFMNDFLTHTIQRKQKHLPIIEFCEMHVHPYSTPIATSLHKGEFIIS